MPCLDSPVVADWTMFCCLCFHVHAGLLLASQACMYFRHELFWYDSLCSSLYTFRWPQDGALSSHRSEPSTKIRPLYERGTFFTYRFEWIELEGPLERPGWLLDCLMDALRYDLPIAFFALLIP